MPYADYDIHKGKWNFWDFENLKEAIGMTKNPEYRLTTPVKLDEERTVWTDVGVGWKTKDKKGISITLNALPVNGKLFLAKITPKEELKEEEKVL